MCTRECPFANPLLHFLVRFSVPPSSPPISHLRIVPGPRSRQRANAECRKVLFRTGWVELRGIPWRPGHLICGGSRLQVVIGPNLRTIYSVLASDNWADITSCMARGSCNNALSWIMQFVLDTRSTVWQKLAVQWSMYFLGQRFRVVCFETCIPSLLSPLTSGVQISKQTMHWHWTEPLTQ